MLREGLNERPVWEIIPQITASSLCVCALFLLHRSNATHSVLLHFSNEVSDAFFGSQFHGLSARAGSNLNLLSDKKVMFQFLCPSRRLDEVSSASTTDDSASYRILLTLGLKLSFSSSNFCIHFKEANRIFFLYYYYFFPGWIQQELDQTFRTFTFWWLFCSTPPPQSLLCQIVYLVIQILPAKAALHSGALNCFYSMNLPKFLFLST